MLGNHDYGFDSESSVTVVKEIFERWAEKVDYENVVEAFLAEIIHVRNAGYIALVSVKTGYTAQCKRTASYENLVCSVFVTQLGRIALPWFLYGIRLLSRLLVSDTRTNLIAT